MAFQIVSVGENRTDEGQENEDEGAVGIVDAEKSNDGLDLAAESPNDRADDVPDIKHSNGDSNIGEKF